MFLSKRSLILLSSHKQQTKSFVKQCSLIFSRQMSTIEPIPEELEEFMEGRARAERSDSITKEILEERKSFSDRIKANAPQANEELIARLSLDGFGHKQRLNFSSVLVQHDEEKHVIGAGGHSLHLASACDNWPLFQHLLPEIAMAGHSNTGKSTLVNALIGVLPKKGPAKVSDRAGWTDQLCFYQLGKKPPVLTLVDLPGYGHAVANVHAKRAWKLMIRDYLSTRLVLTRCCILVDCTRGLCEQDELLLVYLQKRNIPWSIVLTKGDLLEPVLLASAIETIEKDIKDMFTEILSHANDIPQPLNKNHNPNKLEEKQKIKSLQLKALESLLTTDIKSEMIFPVSSSSGAGLVRLWKQLKKWVDKDATTYLNDHSVREHRKAAEVRRDFKFKAANNAPVNHTLSNRNLRKIK